MKRLLLAGFMLFAACGDDDGVTADATPPCTIPAEGMCNGAVLSQCVDNQVVTTDCAAAMGVCAFVDTANACTNECEQQGVTEEGTCTAEGVRRCAVVGGLFKVVTDACADGTTCVQPVGGAAACASDPCFAVGPQGRCSGDTLTTCDAGTPVDTDCALTSQVCAYVNDATGYACVDAGTVGAFTVTGTVTYEDRPPLTSGGLGQPTPLPARGVTVAVIAADGTTVLATGMTSDDGTYTLKYAATMGDLVHVSASTVSLLPGRPLKVTGKNNSLVIFAFGGADFAADVTAVSDVLVTDASGVSEAFNIFDVLLGTLDSIRNDLLDPTPSPLVAHWAKGSSDGTFYSGQIHLLGELSDDDGYDDTVILHESGHYVEDTQGRSDSPGGGHDGSPTDPNLAWSEGFSTYWNFAVRGKAEYMDSNSGGGWFYDGDATVDLTPNPAGAMDQDVGEDMISEIMWDMGDGSPTDDDPFFGAGHGPVVRVQTAYLRVANLRAVGEPGVDLVDFLDGYFKLEGLSNCAGARGVVTTMHKFPYDYAGPGGNCPP